MFSALVVGTEVTEPDKRHRSRDELLAALPHILAAPKDNGELRMIVSRPEHGKRVVFEETRITSGGGVTGDHWSKGCWRETEDGLPHPDVQICIMSVRSIEAIAGARENWPAAGDNLFIDMDLSPANMPPGTRFTLGTAEMIVSQEPHFACQTFIDHYGRDACLFVNTGPGKLHRLRGLYARVLRDGTLKVGDRVRKLD